MHPRVLLPTLAVVAAATVVTGATAAPAPQLQAHQIFSGGVRTLHVGAVVQLSARDAQRHAVSPSRVCVTPAPIDRASCHAGTTFAPSATGAMRVTATLPGGGSATRMFTVHRAATRVGGPTAVPGRLTCAHVTLYGNYDSATHRLRDKIATLPQGTKVGLYNRLGPARFAWAYGADRGGFVLLGCVAKGLTPPST